jgi:hypothetical protein
MKAASATRMASFAVSLEADMADAACAERFGAGIGLSSSPKGYGMGYRCEYQHPIPK